MIEKCGLYKCKKSIKEEVSYWYDEEETQLAKVELKELTKGEYYFIELINLNEFRPYQNLNIKGDNNNIVRMSDYDTTTGVDMKGEKYSDYVRWYFKDYFYSNEELRKIKIEGVLV
jgi:hypothetical protein